MCVSAPLLQLVVARTCVELYFDLRCNSESCFEAKGAFITSERDNAFHDTEKFFFNGFRDGEKNCRPRLHSLARSSCIEQIFIFIWLAIQFRSTSPHHQATTFACADPTLTCRRLSNFEALYEQNSLLRLVEMQLMEKVMTGNLSLEPFG